MRVNKSVAGTRPTPTSITLFAIFAKKAGEVYVDVGKPPRKQFYLILTNGWLNNCPVTAEDARRYFEIYGNAVATLQGKTSIISIEFRPKGT